MVKIFKKKSCLFTCMLFLKHLREKSQRTKISGRKLLITSLALFFVRIKNIFFIFFTRIKNIKSKSYLLHDEPLFLCIFF